MSPWRRAELELEESKLLQAGDSRGLQKLHQTEEWSDVLAAKAVEMAKQAKDDNIPILGPMMLILRLQGSAMRFSLRLAEYEKRIAALEQRGAQ